MTTGSGEVQVDDVTGSAKLKSGSGTVTAGTDRQGRHDHHRLGRRQRRPSAGQSAQVSVGSGDIKHRPTSPATPWPRPAPATSRSTGSAARCVTKSGSGDLVVRRATSGSVKANGASGSITIGVAQGTAAWLDVSTLTGRVIQELDADRRSHRRPATSRDHRPHRERRPPGAPVMRGMKFGLGKSWPRNPVPHRPRQSCVSAPAPTAARSAPAAWVSDSAQGAVEQVLELGEAPLGGRLVVHRGVGHRVAVSRPVVHLVAGGEPRVARAPPPG